MSLASGSFNSNMEARAGWFPSRIRDCRHNYQSVTKCRISRQPPDNLLIQSNRSFLWRWWVKSYERSVGYRRVVEIEETAARESPRRALFDIPSSLCRVFWVPFKRQDSKCLKVIFDIFILRQWPYKFYVRVTYPVPMAGFGSSKRRVESRRFVPRKASVRSNVANDPLESFKSSRQITAFDHDSHGPTVILDGRLRYNKGGQIAPYYHKEDRTSITFSWKAPLLPTFD